MSFQMDNSQISKVLGQRVSAPAVYDSTILVKEPRQNNRTYLGLNDDKLPFVGFDLWNNWEVSALTDNGLPITGIAQIVYNCNSKYIVESKSAKLYFNSFNMTRLGSSSDEVLKNLEQYAERDLSSLLETRVTVRVFPAHVHNPSDASNMHSDRYILLENSIENIHNIKITKYTEDPELIIVEDKLQDTQQFFKSTLLRSNCRVTHQPDHGDVYIYMKSKRPVTTASLLQYIISFRDECHFHEEICEAIYTRLLRICNPTELKVACYYVRRGSLDINPVRATHLHLLEDHLNAKNLRYNKTPRQ